ncbi:MAG: VWA domain-containing protein [Acidobacteria bacterium]|nr:VWA domain-containing protein [Acidobacteriota bacterium]
MGRLCSLSLIAFAAFAQQQPAPPVFRSEVKLVRLLATVKDFHGTMIGGLDKSDFTILDNGVRQEIAVFERYTAQPLSIAVLLDTSASIAKDLKIATASVKRFLQAVIQDGNPNDEAALFTFNHEVSQHTGYTRKIQQIENRVKPLKAEAGTSLYDAIYLAAQSLDSREGRRVIVIVTDGGDTTSSYRYHDALKAAHMVDAPIYSLLLMPILNDVGRNIGGENALTTLGQSTGGRLFTPTVGAELDQALAEILKDLRTQYLIGYYPKNIPYTKEKFHNIRLDLSRRDLRAVTRSGYYE